MGKNDPRSKDEVSREFVRRVGKRVNKFELDASAVGIRYSTQLHREIRRLHTFRPGERCELDYTKYGQWLFPTRYWKEPLFFFTGLGLDDMGDVCSGFVVTSQPTAASTIRLYKRCVLPSRLWLPDYLQKYADDWDVCGLARLVAVDNAMDATAIHTLLMFMAAGAILLCMPPKRGDLKGSIERALYGLETTYMSTLPGYVPLKYKFTDPRQKRLQERAKAQAKLTVREYEEFLLLAILEHNNSQHPRFKRPRIQVYRNGLEAAPPVLPTGRTQIDSIFALTYEKRKLTREGVEAGTFMYNSAELNELYRTSDTKVDVKVNPDDVRTALVYSRELDKPIVASLTTHCFPGPTTLELANEVIGRRDESDEIDGDSPTYGSEIQQKLHDLQSKGRRGPRKRGDKDAQASVHAAELPPVEAPTRSTISDEELAGLFDDQE